jgi:tetratricopeptide (TPR) repeat protein
MVLARLDRLAGQVRAVAQTASVIGRHFGVRLLAQIVGQEEPLLQTLLRDLQSAEIAFPRRDAEAEYVFKHVTLQEVAYHTLLHRRRHALHGAVAQALAGLYPDDEYVETIAYHYDRSEDHAEAVRWLERAGDHAAASFATAAALAHFKAAHQHLDALGAPAAGAGASELPQAPDRELSLPSHRGSPSGDAASSVSYRLHAKMGDLRLLTGDYGAARDDFARARALAADPAQRVELGCKEGKAWEKLGEYARALATFAALDVEVGQSGDAGRLPPGVRADLDLARGDVLYRQGDYDSAEQAAGRARALLEGASPDGDAGLTLAHALHLHGLVAYQRGDLAQAEESHRQSLALRERLGDRDRTASSFNNLGLVAAAHGNAAEAEACFRRSLAIKERIGDEDGMALCWEYLGSVAAGRGDLAEAEACYRRGLAIQESIGDQWGCAGSWHNLGELACERGELAWAEECHQRSVAIKERIGDREGWLESQISLGAVAYEQGDGPRAVRRYGVARRLARRMGIPTPRRARPWGRRALSCAMPSRGGPAHPGRRAWPAHCWNAGVPWPPCTTWPRRRC